jgi:nucleotide-binding universal stress UspA family protein
MSIEIRRVLAATDFSPAGQRAVGLAAEWARKEHARLRIVHVTPPEGWLSRAWGVESSATAAIQKHATNLLKQLADSIDPDRTIELSTGVLSGAASRSIASAVHDYRADLLFVGARGEHGDNGERTLGGTAMKLLATAQSALFLVRGTSADPVASVVAAVDLSPRSRGVLQWADLAAADRHLHAYHAYDVPFAGRLQAYGLVASAVDAYAEQARSQHTADLAALLASIGRTAATSLVVERGDAAVELLRYVESVEPALVVLGKHATESRSAATNTVGDVSRFIAGTVSVDVLVV